MPTFMVIAARTPHYFNAHATLTAHMNERDGTSARAI